MPAFRPFPREECGGAAVSHPPPHSVAVEFVRDDYGRDGREGDVGSR
jgi:hypothetical protein